MNKEKYAKLQKYKEINNELDSYKPIIEDLKEQLKDLEYELKKPETCHLCNLKFKTFQLYVKHYKAKHHKTTEKTECSICRLKFNTLEERSNHKCRCTRWLVCNSISKGKYVKQCDKHFLKTFDKQKHKCKGFRTKEAAERALELRNKNIKVPPPQSTSESDASESSPEPQPNICIKIEPKPPTFDREKAYKIDRDFCLKLETQYKVLFNGVRMWNNVVIPTMNELELEDNEYLTYYKGIVYSDVKDINDFNIYQCNYTPVLCLDGDEFVEYESDDD
jgi:hypothetical protein